MLSSICCCCTCLKPGKTLIEISAGHRINWIFHFNSHSCSSVCWWTGINAHTSERHHFCCVTGIIYQILVFSVLYFTSAPNQMFMKFSHINVLCGRGSKIGLLFCFHWTVCETVSTVLTQVYCLWRVSVVSILRPPIPRHSDWAGWAAHAEPSGTKGRIVNKEG